MNQTKVIIKYEDISAKTLPEKTTENTELEQVKLLQYSVQYTNRSCEIYKK